MHSFFSLLSRARLRRRPNHAPSSSPGELPREPYPAPSTASILARFPVEVLLHVISYLPPESAISLSLASKYYYATLSPHVDLTLSRSPQNKKRLLRLLEVDWPDMMACHGCNVLYRWKQTPVKYVCWETTLRYKDHLRGVRLCFDHTHFTMYLSVVEAYIRGHEMGPAYGPPLSELTHSCRGRLFGDDKKETEHSIQARVVRGKLLLHRTFKTPISLLDSTGLELDKFGYFGCCHSHKSLPAVVMEAIEHREEVEDFSTERRCWDSISCAHCATDLRVRIEPRDAENVHVRVDLWQCFGGRDPELEDPAVQAMFHRRYTGGLNLRATPPTRRLELFYVEETCEEGLSAPALEPKISRDRRTWLQLWRLDRFPDGHLDYQVPTNG